MLGLAVHPFFQRSFDTRRVVLLVPKAGLLLLRAVKQAELYLALSGTVSPFDNHFVSIHTAFVRARRGSDGHDRDEGEGWRSSSRNLAVRDTTENDPERGRGKWNAVCVQNWM